MKEKLLLFVFFALGFPIAALFLAIAFKGHFAFDRVAADFASIFLGETVSILAGAAHFEGHFVAGHFAVADLDVLLPAVDRAGEFVAFGLELENALSILPAISAGCGPRPCAVNVGGLDCDV